jgi:hypothetical protein
MAHHFLDFTENVSEGNSTYKCAVVVERQTRYLEGVVSHGRAGSNPVYRTITYSLPMYIGELRRCHKALF